MHAFFWLYLTINVADSRLTPLDRNTYADILQLTKKDCLILKLHSMCVVDTLFIYADRLQYGTFCSSYLSDLCCVVGYM